MKPYLNQKWTERTTSRKNPKVRNIFGTFYHSELSIWKVLSQVFLEPMRLRYLVTLKGTGKVNRKVSHVTYVKRFRAWFNGGHARATGKVVRCSKSERTENTTVIKEPEVRSLPGTFLFILQNKVNETICKKVKGGVLLELIYIKYTGGT